MAEEVKTKTKPCHYCRGPVDPMRGYVSGIGRYGGYVCDNDECSKHAEEEIEGRGREDLEVDREEFYAKHGEWR